MKEELNTQELILISNLDKILLQIELYIIVLEWKKWNVKSKDLWTKIYLSICGKIIVLRGMIQLNLEDMKEVLEKDWRPCK